MTTTSYDTPWTFEPDYCTDDFVDSGASYAVIDARGEIVSEGRGRGEQMEHAVECVNAMEGIRAQGIGSRLGSRPFRYTVSTKGVGDVDKANAIYIVECVNALEPGGIVQALVGAVNALAMVQEVAPSADIGAMEANWKMIRKALKPFAEPDPQGDTP